jgi:hypothetical protein
VIMTPHRIGVRQLGFLVSRSRGLRLRDGCLRNQHYGPRKERKRTSGISGARRNNSRTAFHSFADKVNVMPLSVARGTSSERRVVADAFIPIYPNALPTVPKPSRSSRTASLVVNNLEVSQSAINRLLNPVVRKNSLRLPSDRDVGTHLFGFAALENPRSQPR